MKLLDKEGNPKGALGAVAKFADVAATPLLLVLVFCANQIPQQLQWIRQPLLGLCIALALVQTVISGNKLARHRMDAKSWMFAFVFISPWLSSAAIAMAMYWLLKLSTERDLLFLLISAMVPTVIAVFVCAVKDERDRVKNTATVVRTQFMALVLVPVVFLVLHQWLPASVNPGTLILGAMVLIGAVNFLPTRQKPWLLKERFQIARTKVNAAGLIDDDVLADIKAAESQLPKLAAKCTDVLDQLDVADAYAELALLHAGLHRYDEAHAASSTAIEKYDALLARNPLDAELLLRKTDAESRLRHIPALKDQP